jgi:histidinol-phosphate aminotransferase
MTVKVSVLETLARPDVRALPLYAADAISNGVDLSDSVNAWGAPPAALRAVAEAATAAVSRYPSARSESLAPALLRYLGLENADGVRVVTGCGSDDVLDATMRAFGSPGDRIVFSTPTFSMIPLFARLNGLVPVAVPFTDDFDLDVERLVAANAKITYLCSPNNPTGTALSRERVEFIASHAGGLVVLDEAYAEFAPETFVDLVRRHERLFIVRTFSKAFGLAGLRVGYGVGASDIVGMVERARGPYKVSVPAERAASAALVDADDALGWVRVHARHAVEIRERVRSALDEVGLPPLPSAANFLCIPTRHATRLAAQLRERGVLVRSFTGLPSEPRILADADGSALRVAVGPWEMMERFLGALAEVIECE